MDIAATMVENRGGQRLTPEQQRLGELIGSQDLKEIQEAPSGGAASSSRASPDSNEPAWTIEAGSFVFLGLLSPLGLQLAGGHRVLGGARFIPARSRA
jgi:hypothetical protein